MEAPMHPVNWFEIPVTDLSRAKAFYEHVLGIRMDLQQMGPMQMAWFPMAQGAPGATGTLMKEQSYVPSREGTVVYFSVDSIETALRKVGEKGGSTLVPKTSIGEFGFTAHFEDSEGNRVGLHARQ